MAGAGRAAVVVLALAAGAWAEDPAPARHENQVSPEAKAAIERHERLAYRPADRGLATMTAALEIDGGAPATWKVEFSSSRGARVTPVEGWKPSPAQAKFATLQMNLPLRAAFEGASIGTSDEYDAEFVDRDGRHVLVLRKFVDGTARGTDELTFGPAGLVESVRPGVDQSDAPKALLEFTWEPKGASHRVASFAATVEVGGQSVRASNSFTWSEAAGIAVVSSMVAKIVARNGDETVVRTSTVRLTGLVVNGAKAEAVNPDAHRNRISAEARAALDRLGTLVYRASDHGLTSATGTLAPGGLAFEVNRQGVQVWPVGREPDARTRSLAEFSEFVLTIATEGPPLAGDAEYDAEFMDRLGTPVLAVTVFKDGQSLERREATLDEAGLPRSIRFVGLGDSPTTSECRFSWTRVGDRWQVASAEMWDAATALHMFVVYAYSDFSGIRLPASIRYSLANLGSEFDGKGTEFSVADLVVNGKRAQTPKSSFHANVVTPEAMKLLGDYERQVYRPSEHGLRSMSGRVVTGGPQTQVQCRFAFAAPKFVAVTVLPVSKADTPEGRTADVRARFPLLLALDSLRTIDALEFDARILTKDGSRVAEVVEYLQGTRTSTSQFTFDGDGLVATYRRTDGTAESGGPTDTCMRLTWERTGHKARITRCDLSTGTFDAPERTSFVVTYSSVAGNDLPISWTVTAAMGGAPIESSVRIEDLVVNGKKIDLPKPGVPPK